MSDATIRPALTEPEWATLDDDVSARCDAITDAVHGPATPRFHAAAALALHGQPFGFTWADVDALTALADDYDREHGGAYGYALAAPVRDVAARLAALLPPQEG